MDLYQVIKDKKVLFITSKNIDYIRNVQEIRLLKKYSAEVEIIYSTKKNNFARMLSVWRKIERKSINRNDIVFVGFAPQLIIPFWTTSFKDKFVIIDFFISVYDTLICDRKKFKDGGLVSKICHKLDEKTIEKSDFIITDTRIDAEYFIQEFNGKRDKFITVYLEADKSVYYPRKQQKRSELKNKYVVLYFGSILPLQGVDIVLDAVKLLQEEKKIFFQIIGPIPKKYNKPIQDNVEYIEWLTQEQLAEYIANADLCLAGHFNGEINKAKRTIPGKAYIYSAMKKTMVLGDNEANREVFSDNMMVFFTEMGNSICLKNVIIDLYFKIGI